MKEKQNKKTKNHYSIEFFYILLDGFIGSRYYLLDCWNDISLTDSDMSTSSDSFLLFVRKEDCVQGYRQFRFGRNKWEVTYDDSRYLIMVLDKEDTSTLGGSIGSLGDFEDQSQIGIKNSDIGCRFIGQWNTILSEMHFRFAILRTKIILSPRFFIPITLFNRKIVIFYCLFRGYQHPESDNVAQTAARLFWNLAIGSSRLVVPTIILGFLDLMDFIADFHYVLRNIMENMLVFMTLTKFGVRRIKCQPLSKFLTEAEDDYIIDNYKTKEVRLIFMKYNNIASKFINKAVTEAVRCEELCLWLHTPIFRHNICPFRLRRNLLACTGFHLTGQLAILKCRVKEFLKNNHDSHGRVRQMILRHYRLISIRKMSLQEITYSPRICFRLADTSEDSFNIVTCLHMVGSTILLCTSYQTSYQMLFSLARLEKVYIFTFLIYFCLLLCTLYSYCYVGQCLIEEVLIEFLLNCNSMCNFTPSFY
ncbi:LOW QUALITY PROTEIN: odorant receptor 13a-like isoform X2 [Vespula squamosa]|uniref:Odorant receptor 13a-like isoform X2 n=1 Tax=Vespula squamosa TaxID=30214 RepID=A0ABD2BHL6_VESSQ